MRNPTKVYLLVECEVEDGGVVNGCDVMTRAARTLSDVIFEGADTKSNDRTNSGKIKFDFFGNVAIGHPSIVMNDDVEILRREVDRRNAEVDEYKESRDEIEKRLRGLKRPLKLHEQLMLAVIEDGKRPAKERWQEMIDRGAINEKGEVLLKAPWPFGDLNEPAD